MGQIDVSADGDVMRVVLPEAVTPAVARRAKALLASAVGVDDIRVVEVILAAAGAPDPDVAELFDEIRRRLLGAGQELRVVTTGDLHMSE